MSKVDEVMKRLDRFAAELGFRQLKGEKIDTRKEWRHFLLQELEQIEKDTAQQAYLIAVESGEGECARAIKTKWGLE